MGGGGRRWGEGKPGEEEEEPDEGVIMANIKMSAFREGTFKDLTETKPIC